MGNEEYPWDYIYPELLQLFQDPWANRVSNENLRQHLATTFAMRSLRRLLLLNRVFWDGFYWEAYHVIRSAYEDWILLAYTLKLPGIARCIDFSEVTHKNDARIYDAFSALCGRDAADRLFPGLTTKVKTYTSLPRSSTRGVPIASMAQDVGLGLVHNFVYAYLSSRSHPDPRMNEIFALSELVAEAKIPTRNPQEEIRPALWFAWFSVRIIVLSSREFGIDREPFCEEYLVPIISAEKDLETCVMVREYQTGLEPGKLP